MQRYESQLTGAQPADLDRQQVAELLYCAAQQLGKETLKEIPVFEHDGTGERASCKRLPAKDPTRMVYEKDAPAVVKITCPIDKDYIAIGSGFFADYQGRIVTALHVVDTAVKPGDITVDTTDGRRFNAIVEKVDFVNDLAILKLDRTPKGVAPLRLSAAETVEPSTPIFLLGHPHGLDTTLATEGKVLSQTSRLKIDLFNRVNTSSVEWKGFPHNDFLLSTAPSRSGNSGGPLVDSNGTVLGVLDMDNGDQIDQCLSVPSKQVRELLATKDNAFNAGTANLPAQFWSSYCESWRSHPFLTAGESGTLAYLAYRMPKLMPTLIPLECGIIGTFAAVSDVQRLVADRSTANGGMHALALGSDTALIAGAVATIMYRRPTPLALALTGCGVAGRMAAASVPTYRALSESATDK